MDYKKISEIDRRYGFFNKLIKPDSKAGPKQGVLSGIAISVKDNICVKGVQSAAGSRILEGYEPPFDATAVARAREAGGVIIGKTNQDEFGFGTFCTNSGYKVPKNPHDPSRCCGGSSGGAAGLAAALPNDVRHIALSESTGGSISCPASFCGVVGLTPTYGLVSRYGLIDYANSLDKIGPIARNARDVATMLSVISGYDPRDQTTINLKPEDYTKYVDRSVKGLKIGVPKEYFGSGTGDGIDKDVEQKVWNGIKELEELGADYKEVSLPSTKYAVAAYYIIATTEASTNLAKFCGMRYGASLPISRSSYSGGSPHASGAGNFNEYFSKVRSRYFGKEAKRRVLLGTYARMAGYRDAYYLKALKARTIIINEFKSTFRKVDVLAAPTMPTIAPKFSEIDKMSPIKQYMMDILTVAPNLAGIPTISVPCGTSKGMPVGLHLMADHLQEGRLIQAASAFDDREEVK
jgi:aspartyl-tRNA(Asn)/glutamyl-tRNA(Gln) amidotransferase subunit A